MGKAPRSHSFASITTNKHEFVKQVQKRNPNRFYNQKPSEWRAIRKEKLKHEPYCRACNERGKRVRAVIVDHIDGDTFNNDSSNLQSLCHSCHSRKTAKHDGAFGNRIKRVSKYTGGGA